MTAEQFVLIATTDDEVDPSLTEENPFHGDDSDDAPEALQPFGGLTHDEALELEVADERYLVDGMIPIGTVGTIASVPETGKSFIAQAIAVRCATGAGDIIGFPVSRQARVGFFWQDDSTREELERIRLFDQAHKSPAGLPLRWFLNEDLQLPRDIDRLLATIRQHELELVILDSFYTVASATDLKDAGPEVIVRDLKREVCDRTGCTVVIVDHMPWANDTNRQRLRAYGGVFKAAAIRWGIYLDANGNNLHVEVRGNNIRGIKKRAAYFDADTLEIRLLDAPEADDQIEVDTLDWIAAYVTDHHSNTGHGIARGKVESAYNEAHGGHGRSRARRIIDRQIRAWNRRLSGEDTGEGSPTLATGPGEVRNGTYLYPFTHAPSPLAEPPNGEDGEAPFETHDGDPLAGLAAPLKGASETASEGRGREQDELAEDAA
jgi:hypothetical protein